jgi:hypothetical protein
METLCDRRRESVTDVEVDLSTVELHDTELSKEAVRDAETSPVPDGLLRVVESTNDCVGRVLVAERVLLSDNDSLSDTSVLLEPLTDGEGDTEDVWDFASRESDSVRVSDASLV